MADEKTVSIPVPAGMDPEKLVALVQSYELRQASNKVYRETRNKAIKSLIEAHKDEYDGLIKKFSPKG